MRARVFVTAPARLHMGFLDLSGALGRNFGSIGVALNDISTKLVLSKSTSKNSSNPRIEKSVVAFCEAFGVSPNVQIEVVQEIPAHVGLGSGTQMALAVGSGLNALYDLNLSVREIAAVMDRGLRSGIGIGIFEKGGLVVDGGRGEKTVTPPMLARFDIPEDWRFILVFDSRGQGLHGQQEIEAFKTLPPFPRAEAEKLSYLLLMQALPAIAENDLACFGTVITQLQKSVGEHFSPAQGGIFTSDIVEKAIEFLAEKGAVAVGQTSWGPTGFCIVENSEIAEKLVFNARDIFANTPLKFCVVSAKNNGGEIS